MFGRSPGREVDHMSTISVQLRNIMDTETEMGWARSHMIVADLPAGKARGHFSIK